MYSESDMLMISGLQHLQFCPRQWGLIHLEQLWAENVLTVEGNIMHERVHSDESESRGDIIIARGLRICSHVYGITGQSDVVEFHRIENLPLEDTVKLNGKNGLWKPYPIEYKRGKPKINQCDEVQLCAQAFCIEEMLKVNISKGAFFYGQPRRRHEVNIDSTLRAETAELITNMHELYNKRITPTASYSKKCNKCSMYELCQPKITGINKKVLQYIQQNMRNDNEENT